MWLGKRALSSFALALLVVAALPMPSAAVGASIQLSVTPPNVTGKPDVNVAGAANFSGFVELFSNPLGQATIAVSIRSQFGWPVAPASFSWRTTAPARYEFEFTVMVPPNATAASTDTVDITAEYRLGGVATATESASVYVTAGGYYAATASRQTAPEVMESGKTYYIDVDLRNTGNAPAAYTFSWTDKGVLDKIRGELVLPAGASIAGFENQTVQIKVKPGTTTPGGKYQVPLQIEIRDRPGNVKGVVNLSLEMEFTNLAIFQGFLPNWDMRAPSTLAGFALIFLGIWFGLHVLVALIRVRPRRSERGTRRRFSLQGPTDANPRLGPGFFETLMAGLEKSLLVRGARRLFGAIRRKKAVPLRPDEVRGRAAAAGRPPR